MTPKLIAVLALAVPLLGLLPTFRRDTQHPTPWPYDPPFSPPPRQLTTTCPSPARQAAVTRRVR